MERVVLPPAGADHDRPLGVSLDGGKMHIRGEGWKEFKAGAVFDLVATPELDRETGEWVDQVHGVNMTYRAVLGNVEEFAPSLWALAVERQVPQAADVAVVGHDCRGNPGRAIHAEQIQEEGASALAELAGHSSNPV